MAREKLDTSLNLSAMGPPPSLPTTSRYATQVTQERLVASQPTPVHIQSASTQSVPSHSLEIRQSVGMNVQKNLYFLIVISTSLVTLTGVILRESVQVSESKEKGTEKRVDIHQPASYSK